MKRRDRQLKILEKVDQIKMGKGCHICREIHEPRPLSFDGRGINACGMYRSRIATFSSDYGNDDRGLGKLFAASPQMLEALELIAKAETQLTHAGRGQLEAIVKVASAAIAKAKGE